MGLYESVTGIIFGKQIGQGREKDMDSGHDWWF